MHRINVIDLMGAVAVMSYLVSFAHLGELRFAAAASFYNRFKMTPIDSSFAGSTVQTKEWRGNK
jgi:hypothetical protein